MVLISGFYPRHLAPGMHCLGKRSLPSPKFPWHCQDGLQHQAGTQSCVARCGENVPTGAVSIQKMPGGISQCSAPPWEFFRSLP